MTSFLSDEWFDALAALGNAGSAAVPFDDCTIEVSVSGAPGGDVKWWATVDRGVVSAAAGPPTGADVALSVTYDDLVAMLHGDLKPSVAFMQGRMKTAGDPGRLLELLRATAEPGFVTARETLAATTAL